jgi:hypothetical protein
MPAMAATARDATTPRLDRTLDFLRLLWSIENCLQSASKRIRMPRFDAMHRRLVESRAGFSASRTSRPVAEPSGLRRGAFGIKM